DRHVDRKPVGGAGRGVERDGDEQRPLLARARPAAAPRQGHGRGGQQERDAIHDATHALQFPSTGGPRLPTGSAGPGRVSTRVVTTAPATTAPTTIQNHGLPSTEPPSAAGGDACATRTGAGCSPCGGAAGTTGAAAVAGAGAGSGFAGG